MGLETTGRSRERILVFGMEGVGKSDAALDIAARIHPRKLWVVDNDNAWDRMVEGESVAGLTGLVQMDWRWEDGKLVEDPAYSDASGNIVIFHVDGWEANAAALDHISTEADPQDWACVDSGTALWADVREWYVEKIFGTSMDDYFLQVRMQKEAAQKANSSMKPLEGWEDYGVINPVYRSKVGKFLTTPPCHLIVTAEQDDFVKPTGNMQEDKENKALYGGAGLNVKPRGQKRIGHNVQTVLHLTKSRQGEWYATTVKDRGGREILERVDVTGRGFGEWYLEEVAGWEKKERGVEKVRVEKKVAEKMSVAKKVVKKG